MSNSQIAYRLIGIFYFPVQFIIVWTVYFGFVLEPGIVNAYYAFDVEGILRAVWSFASIIPNKALSAESIMLFVLGLLPNLFYILLASYRVIFFLFVCYQTYIWLLSQISMFTRQSSDNTGVVIKIGAPGSGKSSSAGYDVIKLAAKMWRNLCYDYWRYESKVEQWRNTNNIQKIQEWYEIRDSYEFYASRPNCIPCLWSNIPIKDLRGSMANELLYEHLYQERRLPAFSVLYIDEIGSVVDVDLYKDKPLDLSAMFRFCRHFGNFRIVATEQSAENVFIDARRVVAYHEYMLSQTWVCKPYGLLILHNILKFVFSRLMVGSRVFAPGMNVLNSIIRHIGFRRYKYCYEGNTERKQSLFGNRKKVYYLPSALNYFYDDRTYRNYYKARELALESRIYGSLVLEEESDAGIRYLRELDARAAAKAEEEEAQLVLLEYYDELVKHASKIKSADLAALLKTYKERKQAVKYMSESDELVDDIKKLIG